MIFRNMFPNNFNLIRHEYFEYQILLLIPNEILEHKEQESLFNSFE